MSIAALRPGAMMLAYTQFIEAANNFARTPHRPTDGRLLFEFVQI